MALFVDTGAWFALAVSTDARHDAASAFMRTNSEKLVTSEFVYDELLTLFRSRGCLDQAADWVNQVETGSYCAILPVTGADIAKATEVFFRFADKRWSFTDCTSLVIMERLRIRRAFAFDEHFRQFGTVTVVP